MQEARHIWEAQMVGHKLSTATDICQLIQQLVILQIGQKLLLAIVMVHFIRAIEKSLSVIKAKNYISRVL
jgi:hypothetical protein